MSVEDELRDLVKHACATALRENRELIREECRAALSTMSGRTGDPARPVDTNGAAELAGVKPTTIRSWVRSGRIQPIGGRPYKFEVAEVERARSRRPSSAQVVDFEARATEILDGRNKRKDPK